MPNWVSNSWRMVAPTKARLDQIISECCDADGTLVFNKIHPYPKDYDIISSAMPIFKVPQPLRSFSYTYDQVWARTVVKYLSNMHGWESLREWMSANWDVDTRMGEHRFERHSDTEIHFMFDTAWTWPLGLAETIRGRYPDVVFEIEYNYNDGDEDGWQTYDGDS